ncbi:MAG TPA: neuraminidase-like domain-containing protein, partial [Polyangiaceae bacterium]|nr:neuraminidase-like domain-containing protein [Polyangiaceae bacterium]
MAAFGRVHDTWNVPVPMVVPALDATLTAEQTRFATLRNGIAFAGESSQRLGGVEEFCASWKGVLLVEENGNYRFWGGAPTLEGEKPDLEHVRGRRWRVTLARGQKSWILLEHDGGEGPSGCSAALSLKKGAYDLCIEFVQCAPSEDDFEDAHPAHGGFQLKYEGPDTEQRIVTIPLRRLYVEKKDATLAEGFGEGFSGAALTFLQTRYFSTLRDVRRTYQRAFKALLFAKRFDLSARPFADFGQSEIGYLLDHPDRFGGLSFYGGPGSWTAHRASFDFDLLPLRDIYFPPPSSPPPAPIPDDRVAPTLQREQALFDIWERVFDYTRLRANTRTNASHPLWLLFESAAEQDPAGPAGNELLRHLHIDAEHAPLIFQYAPSSTVTYGDLVDERWAVRVWRADESVECMAKHFLFADLAQAKPPLWASDDLAAGNANLTEVVRDGLIENGEPRRYEDLARLNDSLRERARAALIAYLCAGGGLASQPKDLSERLLLDVEVGICQKASRIEEAITAIQTFVQRARLGLEPSWTPSAAFVRLWERRFETYRTWEACERRGLYRENWVEWDELENAREMEAFRLLEDRLRRSTLSVPVPGGLEYWTGEPPPVRPGLLLLQERDPSAMILIPKRREGLNLLGTPERAAQRSWLAPVQRAAKDDGGGRDNPGNPNGPPRTNVPAATVPPRNGLDKGKLPLWLEAAIRLGTRFVRVAAAGVPPAAMPFAPREHAEDCCRDCNHVHDAHV